MLSTLKVTLRFPCGHGGLAAVMSQPSPRVFNNQQTHRRCFHEDRKTAPEIQDFEPYSKLPYYDGKKGHLMYVGNMTKVVKGIKMFSISTSLVTVGSIPLIRSAIEESLTKAGVMGTISTLIFLTPFLLHFVTRKYVTDIYFNAETDVFTLATKSLLLRRKELEFYATDVEVPFVGGAFVTHRVKKKPHFIERELFFNKEVYMKMVGYDKPHVEKERDPEELKVLEKIKAELEKDSKQAEDFGLFSDKVNESSDKEKGQSDNLGDKTDKTLKKDDNKQFGLFNEKN